MNYKKTTILLFLLAVVITVFSGCGKPTKEQKNLETKEQNVNSQKLCTQEAKICPDGTSVGRIGPNCEFAECPEVNIATSSEENLTYEIASSTTQKICDNVYFTFSIINNINNDFNCSVDKENNSIIFNAWGNENIIKSEYKNDWKDCTNETLGLNLKYPPIWKECYTNINKLDKIIDNHDNEYISNICKENNCFIINTNYNNYDSYVVFIFNKIENTNLLDKNSIEEILKYLINNRIISDDLNWYLGEKNNGGVKILLIAQNGVGGGDGIYNLIKIENNFYSINMDDIFSSEPISPEDKGGIWIPGGKPTLNERINILNSIELKK